MLNEFKMRFQLTNAMPPDFSTVEFLFKIEFTHLGFNYKIAYNSINLVVCMVVHVKTKTMRMMMVVCNTDNILRIVHIKACVRVLVPSGHMQARTTTGAIRSKTPSRVHSPPFVQPHN